MAKLNLSTDQRPTTGGTWFSNLRCLQMVVVVVATMITIGEYVTYVSAQADINNGTIRLGINPDGSLIITPINVPKNSTFGSTLLGVRYMPTNQDGSAFGAPVDGWGIADTITKKFGTGVKGGSVNLAAIVQTSTASTAKSTATANAILQVTHDFHPSAHPNAYEITVTVTNVSAATVNAIYRRTIDWDIEPNPTSEFVTIQGANIQGVISFTDDALITPQNPLMAPFGTNGDFVNKGPGDLGTSITLDLGSLPPGTSVTFNHYYGATADRPSAVAAINAIGMQGFSISSPSPPGGSAATVGTPNTFFYGFFGAIFGPRIIPRFGDPGEGHYSGGRGPIGDEGSFGWGGGGFGGGAMAQPPIGTASRPRALSLPALLGPYLDGPDGPSRRARVFNVAHRQQQQEESETPDALNPDTVWTWVIFAGVALGLMLLISYVAGVPVITEVLQRRLF